MQTTPILTINSGSSSLKVGLFIEREGEEHVLFDVLAEGLGKRDGKLEVRNEAGKLVRSEALVSKTQEQALEQVALWLGELHADEPAAIGHRVVHGGLRFTGPVRVDSGVLAELESLVPLGGLTVTTGVGVPVAGTT